MVGAALAALTLMFVGCKKEEPAPNQPAPVRAVVDGGRAEHYFDVPFPSDGLLTAAGTPDLSGFPQAISSPTSGVIEGWAKRIEQTSVGFGVNTPAYFRFEDPLSLPLGTAGELNDPVLWLALDGSGELLPLTLRFVQDPAGDTFYGPNTLAAAPILGSPPRAGVRYAVVVTDQAGAMAPAGYEPDPDVVAALDDLGFNGNIAVATTFTTADTTGELRSLAADVDSQTHDWSNVGFERVISLRYEQGTTPSGKASTLSIATLESGEQRTTYLAPSEGAEAHTTDLLDWPMAVYEGTISTYNYQGLAQRPYMSPSLGHLGDVENYSGWMDFDASGLLSSPELEPMRITIQLPKNGDGSVAEDAPVVIFDHGTSGHAYNIVQRRSIEDNGLALATRFADAGFAVIGRDASLYGVRYPLIDEGHGGSLGFYNIVNAPAFRDNQRQTALDGYVVRRFVDEGLNDALPSGSVNPSRVRRMGHSLGSVTSNLGVAMTPDDYEAVLLSGTGGVFLHYFFDTGLLQDIDPSTIALLFPLFGAQAPEQVTTTTILGAVLGLDEAAWDHLDRLHPAAMLFQWQMDPSDPMAVARDETAPITMVVAPGDWQTPDFTAYALADAMPSATVVHCEALGSYDPHYCLWREQEGFDALEAWLAE